MHGKERKGITTTPARTTSPTATRPPKRWVTAKWQYVCEDALLAVIDDFFEQQVFGTQRIARFLEQRATLAGELRSESREERNRLERRLSDVDQRVELVRAIEAGVDPLSSATASRHSMPSAMTSKLH
jgi:hypothetical protein